MMVCPLTDRLLVATLAAKPLMSGTGLPNLVPSIWNCTVPVGVPILGLLAEIVAVKLTDWPKTEGLAVEARVAVVGDMVRVKTTLFGV